jgi:hypothetical protein
MFEIIRVVYNSHADELGLPKLSEDGVKISIQESKVGYSNVDEKIKDYGFSFTQKLKTPIDYILESRDDLTRQEAETIYEDNVKWFELNTGKTETAMKTVDTLNKSADEGISNTEATGSQK